MIVINVASDSLRLVLIYYTNNSIKDWMNKSMQSLFKASDLFKLIHVQAHSSPNTGKSKISDYSMLVLRFKFQSSLSRGTSGERSGEFTGDSSTALANEVIKGVSTSALSSSSSSGSDG